AGRATGPRTAHVHAGAVGAGLARAARVAAAAAVRVTARRVDAGGAALLAGRAARGALVVAADLAAGTGHRAVAAVVRVGLNAETVAQQHAGRARALAALTGLAETAQVPASPAVVHVRRGVHARRTASHLGGRARRR